MALYVTERTWREKAGRPLLLPLPRRFLLGALNGVSAVCKTMVSEVCGKQHEVVGMGVTTSESGRNGAPVKRLGHQYKTASLVRMEPSPLILSTPLKG